MPTIDGKCRCDICKQEISGTDLFLEKSLAFEDDKHACYRCIDDYIQRFDESRVESFEQIHEYTSENGNRLMRNGSSADKILDELIE